MAVRNINKSSDVLPNHNLFKYNFSAGQSVFNYEYALEQLTWVRDNDLFGYAMISPFSSGVTIAIIGTLAEIGIELPMCGMNMATQLSVTEDFPLYMRTSITSVYQNVLIIQFIKQMKWNKIGFLYHDDSWANGTADHFIEQAAVAGLEILNPPDLYQYTNAVGWDSIDLIMPHLTAFVNSGARILILITF